MRISAINIRRNISLRPNISPKNNINYTIRDSVSFSGKQTKEPTLLGANYTDMLKTVNTQRTRTVPQLKSAYKKGEDIREERDKLIISRIPKALEDAKEFVSEHPEFDIEDVEQDLVKMVITATDNELTTTSDYRTFGPNFNVREGEYFERLLGRQKKDNKILPEVQRYLVIDQEEGAPEEVHVRLEKALEDENLIETIEKALSRLKPQYQEIIIKRFGLDGNEPMTLSEIGNTISTTGENVRQLEKKAMRDLKKAYLDVIYENMVQGKYDEY